MLTSGFNSRVWRICLFPQLKKSVPVGQRKVHLVHFMPSFIHHKLPTFSCLSFVVNNKAVSSQLSWVFVSGLVPPLQIRNHRSHCQVVSRQVFKLISHSNTANTTLKHLNANSAPRTDFTEWNPHVTLLQNTEWRRKKILCVAGWAEFGVNGVSVLPQGSLWKRWTQLNQNITEYCFMSLPYHSLLQQPRSHGLHCL